MLATRNGRCIRFQAEEETLRVFAGRASDGVRGIRLLGEDKVISLAVLRHVSGDLAEFRAYLRVAAQRRRQAGEEGGEAEAEAAPAPAEEADEPVEEVTLTPDRIAELAEAEQFILAVTEKGFGKRSSAYEYRLVGRGGQGIRAIGFDDGKWRTGREVVATFTVEAGDHLILVTDGGKVMRTMADQVRVTGRTAMGVRIARPEADERVMSCFPVMDDEEEPSQPGDAVGENAQAAATDGNGDE
jgi:DNA gyrase subunit A